MMTIQLTLSEIHDVEFRMIQFIVDFCEKHALSVFLDSGTLLGGVREHDFLAWDDDADLIMPREDFEKFCRLFQNQKDYHLIGTEYCQPYLKVYDSRTCLTEEALRFPRKIGVYVDIFPLDVLPARYSAQQQYFKRIKRLVRFQTLQKLKFVPSDQSFRQKIKGLISDVLGWIPYDYLANIIDAKAKKFRNINSPYLTQVVCTWNDQKRLKSTWFEQGRTVRFRNSYFPIPSDAEAYLTQLYGSDFMIPPAANKIVKHGYPVYWNNKEGSRSCEQL